MSKFILAFTKKQIFIPNGDNTGYVEILGCSIKSINGPYYRMDPITINDKTYNLCFTNGIYMLELDDFPYLDSAYLYELDNSILKQKFHYFNNWFNSETGEPVVSMSIGIRAMDGGHIGGSGN